MGPKWSPAELKRLREHYEKKPAYITDIELARRLSGKFKRSQESIRWQLRNFTEDVKVGFPKILLLDIETLFMEADVWHTYKVDIRPVQIRKDWSVICWSAKWLFDKKMYGEVVSPKDAVNREDRKILPGIWELMNDADMVITQNGDNFDFKRLNTRFLKAGMPPPMYYKSVDTYKVFKQNFAFTYNSLDWVADFLGVGRKLPTSHFWWSECSKGNPEYLSKMLEYNMYDVSLLEEVYLKIRPWVSNGLNMNLFSLTGANACRNCGSVNIKWNGKYSTALGLYKGFRCQECGSIGRSTLKKYKLSKSEVQ